MAKKWALEPELVQQIQRVSEQLNVEVEDLRNDYDDKSESWRDGDRGTEVGAWIEELENLADTLQDLQTEV